MPEIVCLKQLFETFPLQCRGIGGQKVEKCVENNTSVPKILGTKLKQTLIIYLILLIV